MLVFILLAMFTSGLLMLSASLFFLNTPSMQLSENSDTQIPENTNTLIYDDVELPAVDKVGEVAEASNENYMTDSFLSFTRTSQKSSKQLPLLGMPDKAFYHIH